MSLPDYYTLLQIPVTATHTEIKAAYRRLAKLYHPDKNYGNQLAEEKFKQIKEAYEVLINTVRRRKYDEKRNRTATGNATTSQKKSGGKKNYNFTEEEAKRRQYYQQHYKTKSAPKTPAPAKKTKSGLSEIKYILISVPIAVALLLLMIRLYEKPKNDVTNKTPATDSLIVQKPQIGTSESPYRGELGKNIFDSSSHYVIQLVNKSGYDAIVFLQNDSNKIIRHHFIENNYQLFLENIPPNAYRLYYWMGKQFTYKKSLFKNVSGSYTTDICVDSFPETIKITGLEKDTLLFSLNRNINAKPDTVLLKSLFEHK